MRLSRRHIWVGGSIAIALCAGILWWLHARSAVRASGAMPQEAYVWQRTWNDDVRHAVESYGPKLGGLCLLAAEVTWENGRPAVTRVAVDYAAVQRSKAPVGLALRIGPYSGPFASDDVVARLLADLVADVLREANAAGVRPTELQIDFDCPTSKLDGYRQWVTAIRRRTGDVPVVITALPAWLASRDFAPLAREAGGFILQVHSLQRPRELVLCDPAAARRAVEQAGKVGVPFRVALPTYGYAVGLDETGRCVGVCAEGPAKDWPEGTTVREVRANAGELAELVRGWTADRPATMRGIIWYRLPTDGDVRNWRWPTLTAVMAGRAPQPELGVQSRREGSLTDVELVNRGEAEASLDVSVACHWSDAGLVSADALGGFVRSQDDDGELRWRGGRAEQLGTLPPGASRRIGWLRLDRDKEVQCDVVSNSQ